MQDSKRISEKAPLAFSITSAVMLFLTGLAKIWSALGHSQILTMDDPVFGIKFSNLFFIAGLLEITLAVCCFLLKNGVLLFGCIASFSTALLIYRFGLWWIGWSKPCNCLGNLTDALHFSPALIDALMRSILVYLLLGSYFLLYKTLFNSGQKPASVKIYAE